jgi:adenylate cyclase, class 2
MHIEIEAKLKVDSLAKVARKLRDCGAEFVGELLQNDTYLDDGKGTMRKTDSALRIRRQMVKGREQVVITFKGPKKKGRFKQRREIEMEISDGNLAEMLLVELGFKKAIVIRKKRREWRLGGCVVALDELPLLGSFVEIEGLSEKKITAVQKKLGLDDLPHIPASYACLMEKKLRAGKKPKK